jgi:hypothetical protein
MNCLILESSGSSPHPTTGCGPEPIQLNVYFSLSRGSTLMFSVCCTFFPLEIHFLTLCNILPLTPLRKNDGVTYYIIFSVYHVSCLLDVNNFLNIVFLLCLTVLLLPYKTEGKKVVRMCVIVIISWIYAFPSSLWTFFCHCLKGFELAKLLEFLLDLVTGLLAYCFTCLFVLYSCII